jgi:hypothetical protein
LNSQVPDLSISIVNHNGKEFLEGLLNSIYQNAGEIAFEVFVADNASTDGSLQMVKQKFPQVILIENEENLYFVKANNQNLCRAVGRYALIINNDAIVQPHSLQRMVEYMDQHSDVGALGPKLLNFDGTLQRTCNRFPTFHYALYEYLFVHRLFPHNRCLQENIYADWDRNSIREVDAVSGACLMVPLRLFKEVGLLDEDNLMYNEEIDLCYRIRKKGYKVVYYPEAQVMHYGGGSTLKRQSDVLVRIYHQSFLNFYKKFYGRNVYLLLKTLYLVSRALLKAQRWLKVRLTGWNVENFTLPRQDIN